MECKFCHAAMEENETLCPVCGKAQEEQEITLAEESVTTPEEEAVPMTLEETAEECPIEENPGEVVVEEASAFAPPAPKKKNNWLWAVVAVVVAAALALSLFLVNRLQEKDADVQLSGGTGYTLASEEELTAEVSATVVAEIRRQTLFTELMELLGTEPTEGITNAELSIYYWDTFFSLYETYAYYIYAGQITMDPLTLDSTVCPLSPGGQTWQEFLLSEALNRYRTQKAVCDYAAARGFTIPEEERKELDAAKEELLAMENVQDTVRATYGPNITVEDYLAYLETQYLYGTYLDSYVESITYTDEDLSAFFDANQASFESARIFKVDKPVVNVRHILITPENTEDEASWAAAKEKAETVYQQYLEGEQTEEAFGELAKTNSADGNAADGGLYTDVYPHQMVTTFNDWCFEDARKPGDTGIVETEFGYHIMYYVSRGETIYWKEAAAADYKTQAVNEWIGNLALEYTLRVDADKIALVLPRQFISAE